jgi:hypothetical protein
MIVGINRAGIESKFSLRTEGKWSAFFRADYLIVMQPVMSRQARANGIPA